MKPLQVYLPEETIKDLKRLALDNGGSVSDLIRACIKPLFTPIKAPTPKTASIVPDKEPEKVELDYRGKPIPTGRCKHGNLKSVTCTPCLREKRGL